tara:strand:+ start:1506 stop:1673 length:168 start_codon:yes stop_codon:yes gene_type:complete
MNRMKIFSIACIIVLVLNLIFFALGLFGPLLFWITILLIAFIAYYVVPKIKAPEQ